VRIHDQLFLRGCNWVRLTHFWLGLAGRIATSRRLAHRNQAVEDPARPGSQRATAKWIRIQVAEHLSGATEAWLDAGRSNVSKARGQFARTVARKSGHRGRPVLSHPAKAAKSAIPL